MSPADTIETASGDVFPGRDRSAIPSGVRVYEACCSAAAREHGTSALLQGGMVSADGSGGAGNTVIDPSALRGGAAGLRPLLGYQVRAVPAITDGLRLGGRGTFIAACGTGKTMVALHTALEVCPSGVVVLTCPTLGLLAQTLDLWASVTQQVLAVCSDKSVAAKARRVHGVSCPVTTKAAEVVTWLTEQPADRLRLILVTHKSAAVAGAGLLAADLEADLLLVDEAHRTAGRVGKPSALMHYDTHLPARRRLYKTATPRVLGPRQDPRRAISMTDEHIYGPELFNYPFAEAIDDGWLDDFQVVAIGITRREVLHLLHKARPDAVVQAGDAPLHTVVVQAALVRAAKQFGLRRILVFARTIHESREFTRTLQRTVDVLAPQERPDGLLTVRHVDGTHTVRNRTVALEVLADPPEDGWTVVSNPHCLNEGIDVPAIDAVVYAHAPGSVIEAVQGVSRALRRNPDGPGIATVLVPMLLPDDGGDLTDLGQWETLLQTLWALRAHDERFAASLDLRRARITRGQQVQLPEQVRILLPHGYSTPDILDHVAVRIVEHASTTWTAGIDALTAFHAEHGHTLVPAGHHAGSLNLHRWLRREQALLNAGQQPADRVTQLHKLGLTPTTASPAEPATPANEAAEQLAAVRAYHGQHGHLRTLPGIVINGVDVHEWLAGNRRPGSTVRTDRALGQVLDALDPGWNIDHEPGCVESLHAAHAYHARYGDLRPAPDTVIDNHDVHQWLDRCRKPESCVQGDQRLRAILTAMDPRWAQPPLRGHDTALRAIRTYHAEHGHALWPPGTVVDGTDLDQLPARLYVWITDGRLSGGQTAAWQALGVGRYHRRNLWFARGIAAARQYLDREGHLNPPDDHQENKISLRRWIASQIGDIYRGGNHTAEQIRQLVELGIGASRPDRNTPTKRKTPARTLSAPENTDENLRAVRAFHLKHGHLFPMPDTVIDDINLCAALRVVRRRYVNGGLSSEEIDRWNALGIVWNTKEAEFAWGITAWRIYRAREGHLNPAPGHYEIGIHLHRWLGRQRRRHTGGWLCQTELDQLIDLAPELFTRPEDTAAPQTIEPAPNPLPPADSEPANDTSRPIATNTNPVLRK
jgi:superfamily II DNA or RNA helicase